MMRLLILKPSSLGDIVHTLMVAQAIKAQRPEAEIHWVVRQGFEPMLAATAIVDKILVFKRKGGLREFFRLLKEIRATRYDAVVDMQALLRTGLMAAAAHAKIKLCRYDQREGAQLFATKVVARPKEGSHAVDKLMEFLPPLGLEKKIAPLKLREGAPAPKLPAGTILMFPTSRGKWANKEWPGFAELTKALQQKGIGPIAWASDLQLPCPEGVLDFTGGKVKLGELLPFVAQARLLVGNDSGPTHMAAALGIPTLGLYGPTLPALAGVYPLSAPQNRSLHAASGRIEDLPLAEVLKAAELLKG